MPNYMIQTAQIYRNLNQSAVLCYCKWGNDFWENCWNCLL